MRKTTIKRTGARRPTKRKRRPTVLEFGHKYSFEVQKFGKPPFRILINHQNKAGLAKGGEIVPITDGFLKKIIREKARLQHGIEVSFEI